MALKESARKSYFDDNITLPNESGKGILVGDYGDSTKSVAFPWRNLTRDIEVRATNQSPLIDPVWSQVGSTNFWAYKFSLTHQCWASFPIPHDYVPSTAVHLFVQWFKDGTESPLDTNAVKWQWDYAFAKGQNQAAFDFALANSPLTTANTIAASTTPPGTAYQLLTTVTAAISLAALTEPGGVIHTRLQRVSNASSPLVEQTEGVFALQCGLYYRSTNLGTKQRTPSFYAD